MTLCRAASAGAAEYRLQSSEVLEACNAMSERFGMQVAKHVQQMLHRPGGSQIQGCWPLPAYMRAVLQADLAQQHAKDAYACCGLTSQVRGCVRCCQAGYQKLESDQLMTAMSSRRFQGFACLITHCGTGAAPGRSGWTTCP